MTILKRGLILICLGSILVTGCSKKVSEEDELGEMLVENRLEELDKLEKEQNKNETEPNKNETEQNQKNSEEYECPTDTDIVVGSEYSEGYVPSENKWYCEIGLGGSNLTSFKEYVNWEHYYCGEVNDPNKVYYNYLHKDDVWHETPENIPNVIGLDKMTAIRRIRAYDLDVGEVESTSTKDAEFYEVIEYKFNNITNAIDIVVKPSED